MPNPTVGDVLSQQSAQAHYTLSDAEVFAQCNCCGLEAPLSDAVRVARGNDCIYRCGACADPLLMLASPTVSSAIRGLDDSSAWTLHSMVELLLPENRVLRSAH